MIPSSGSLRVCHEVLLVLIAFCFLIDVCSLCADQHAAARFKGTGKADPIRITNVSCGEDGAKGTGIVGFDLAWDHSWRAAWEVPAAAHGGKDTLKLENWDGAWIFVKFKKPGVRHWEHATLSTKAGDHHVPAGASVDPGMTDDGKQAVGVFIYRNAPGSGQNKWNGVKLRWLAGADGVKSLENMLVTGARPARKSPKKKAPEIEQDEGDGLGGLFEEAFAEKEAADATKRQAGSVQIRVCAIHMVYVPEGAFWAGDGTTEPNFIAGQLTASNTAKPIRIKSEEELRVGGRSRTGMGNNDCIGTYDDFSTGVSFALPARYPKGYAASYCMKHEITRGEMAMFLNTLSENIRKRLGDGSVGQGIRRQGSGASAVYVADVPHMPCGGFSWTLGTNFAAWAGLRPMSELEFEKVCRGPLKPVPGEFAWGTAEILGTNSKEGPPDGYEVVNAYKPNERVEWVGPSDPNAKRGNAAWLGTIWQSNRPFGFAANEINRPLRAGIFATPESDRVTAGASYWGIMELSGNLVEGFVRLGHARGRQFAGGHGGGNVPPEPWEHLDVGYDPATVTRGGGLTTGSRSLQVSARGGRELGGQNRVSSPRYGFRCVRSAAAGRPPVAASDPSVHASRLFNKAVRIENVKTSARDVKTATLTFDIAWDDSWRDAKNHDAAWVFFKTHPQGMGDWQHVKLVADRVLNPRGYSRGEGTPVDLIVPDGKDGFTGLFIQRSEAGKGAVKIRGVTVLCEALPLKPSLQPFGIEMVYVPGGAFYLGSGGSEANRFFKYTDGSQNTLPYLVSASGAIPTGPQKDRLWATGAQPDGSDAGELPAAYPKGYRAFYCMKWGIKQGQFAAFLSLQSKVRSIEHQYQRGNWPVRTIGRIGGEGLTWWQGAGFAAWAGLRPMTELEYEKARRGPEKPVPNEMVQSFWEIRDLAGGTPFDRVVSVEPAAKGFAGTHGLGEPVLPKDWPAEQGPGTALRGGGIGGAASVSHRNESSGNDSLTRQSARLPGWRYEGWRGVRTAPGAVVANTATTGAGKQFALKLDPLPDLREHDINIVVLSGSFLNGSDKALKVTVGSAMPDGCFPGGAAARTLTAAAGAETPFQLTMVLAESVLRTARYTQRLPFQVLSTDGNVLSEATVNVPLDNPLAAKPPVVRSVTGGRIHVAVANMTGRAHALTIRWKPPADIKIKEPEQRFEIGPHATAKATFVFPPQPVSDFGYRALPYQVVTANGAAQTAETVTEFRVQSRWWVGQYQIPDAKGPKISGVGISDDENSNLEGLDGLGEIVADPQSKKKDSFPDPPPDLFTAKGPPERWKEVVHGGSLWVSLLDPLPKANTIVLAATRVYAPTDREATLSMVSESRAATWVDNRIFRLADRGLPAPTRPFFGRIWLNGKVVHDTRSNANTSKGPARLRKGQNTLFVQCKANTGDVHRLANLFVLFLHPKNGHLMKDLVLDVQGRP
jgi:hypothetical protein